MIFTTDRTIEDKYNIADLNQVEGNIQTLSDTLDAYGYNINASSETWTTSEYFQDADDIRVMSSIDKFKSNFYLADEDTPATFGRLTYIGANNIEKLLEKVYNNIINMEKSFKLSGTFVSGGDLF